MPRQAALIALLLAAFAASSPAAPVPKLAVVVSLPPMARLIERIGGERVAVHTLALPGESAETFQPTDAQVSATLGARIFFRLGLPFEDGPSFSALAARQSLLVVDLRQGIELLEDDHNHAPDPHHWLSPRRLRIHVARIVAALSALDPAGRALFEQSAREIDAELAALDLAFKLLLAPHQGRAFFVFHPEWTYFAADYGLRQLAIERDGKEPSDRELTELIREARREKARAIFVPPQIASRGAHALAEVLGVPVLTLDALATDLPRTIENAANCIAAALEAETQSERKVGPCAM